MIDLQIYKHYNKNKTILKWKLFTKVINQSPNEESLGLDRQIVLI